MAEGLESAFISSARTLRSVVRGSRYVSSYYDTGVICVIELRVLASLDCVPVC